jgi:endoglycosylceramidase
MLTEFGATDDRARIESIVDLADEHMVSWMWWAYCGCDDPTTSGPGDLQAIVKDPARPLRGHNVLHRKLALIDRPYPQAIAGTPIAFGYDRDADTFQLEYRTKSPDGERLERARRTRVYVPRIHYPDGYDAVATGARIVSAEDARFLLLKRDPGAGRVELRISPRSR